MEVVNESHLPIAMKTDVRHKDKTVRTIKIGSDVVYRGEGSRGLVLSFPSVSQFRDIREHLLAFPPLPGFVANLNQTTLRLPTSLS